MFQFIGSIIDGLLMTGIGALAFIRPQSLANKDGPAEGVAKRLRLVKRCGGVLFLAGIGLLVVKLI